VHAPDLRRADSSYGSCQTIRRESAGRYRQLAALVPAFLRSCGDLRLPRTPTRPLARHDDALDQEFSTPDTPRLTTLESTGETGESDRAAGAKGLGEFDISWRLGEEQLRVIGPARKLLVEALELVERGELHVTSL
jgi:hypothetical protein